MDNSGIRRVDVIIAGAGFAGSLMALILHQSGFRVCLVEKKSHPRFAIGESSTPIADMILRKLSDDYNLPWLKHFSRYGSWQDHYPAVVCGIKRGFSYFRHTKGEWFRGDAGHSRELLVAASRDDIHSDTNWLRSDFDSFLVEKVKEYGIFYVDNSTITDCRRTKSSIWEIELTCPDGPFRLESSFLVDATGTPAFLNSFLHIDSGSSGFETNTMAVYSHFKNVSPWSGYMSAHSSFTDDYPFDPDHSALHHIIDEGWVWMLRFNNSLVSAGAVVDLTHDRPALDRGVQNFWEHLLDGYPSIASLFDRAELADDPGTMMASGRLQRKLSRITGDGWIALNHTAGFIDPLHSTGIAHTLSGIEKTARILVQSRNDPHSRLEQLAVHQSAFYKELSLLDLLVAGCYRTRNHFQLFSAWCMLYFTCTIHYERNRIQGNTPALFLSAGNSDLVQIVENAYQGLQELMRHTPRAEESDAYIASIRKKIRPFNTAGLLDESAKNMYEHTAIEI